MSLPKEVKEQIREDARRWRKIVLGTLVLVGVCLVLHLLDVKPFSWLSPYAILSPLWGYTVIEVCVRIYECFSPSFRARAEELDQILDEALRDED